MRKLLFILFIAWTCNAFAVDTKVSALTALTTEDGGDLLYVIDDPAGTPLSKKITIDDVFDAIDTSAELAAYVTDETGSGALVFATSPTLVTPALGTPASGVATNLTGTAAGLTAGTVTTNANLTGDVTSVGNATSIAAGVIVDADLASGVFTNITGLGVQSQALDMDGSNIVLDTDGDTLFTEVSDDLIELTVPSGIVGAGLRVGNSTIGFIQLSQQAVALSGPTIDFTLPNGGSAQKGHIRTSIDVADDAGSDTAFMFEVQRTGSTNIVNRKLFSVRNNATTRWDIAATGDVDGYTNTWDNFAVGSSVTGIVNANVAAGAAIASSKLATVDIAQGGTGQTTAQAAIDALSAVSGATNEHVLTKDTATGNAIFKAASSGFSDPMTTRGDIIIRDATNTTARLAIGTASQVLTSDGTDISWGAAGTGDMVLASVQTVTGAKTFGTIGGAVGKFILAGSTSGSTIVNAAAVAGTTTITLPGSTDTLVGRATTDTLTNKTLTTPTIGSFTNATHDHTNAAGGGQIAASTALSDFANLAQVGGDVFTGVHDFGGATSLEMVNAAAPTVDALGEFALDTTDNSLAIHDGTSAKVYAHPVHQATFTVYDDGTWDSEAVPIWIAPKDMAVTITQVHAATIGTTPSLNYNIEERAKASLASAGTDIYAADQAADATGEDETAFSNAGIAAGAHLVLTTGASSETGTVELITGVIYYTKDLE